jgi:dTDP-4-dehydrorhamnose 3,5-epimerase
MELLNEPLPGLLELQTLIHKDQRGSFSETFSRRRFAELGIDHEFVQDNESRSTVAGTVRGLHLQVDPDAQGKLVRVLEGAIYDVAVDLRPDSSTFLHHAGIELHAGDSRLFWIPPGFAHGFCTLTEHTTVSYKVTSAYSPTTERSIRWDDPDLQIVWPVKPGAAVLSDKDGIAASLADFRQESLS